MARRARADPGRDVREGARRAPDRQPDQNVPRQDPGHRRAREPRGAEGRAVGEGWRLAKAAAEWIAEAQRERNVSCSPGALPASARAARLLASAPGSPREGISQDRWHATGLGWVSPEGVSVTAATFEVTADPPAVHARSASTRTPGQSPSSALAGLAGTSWHLVKFEGGDDTVLRRIEPRTRSARPHPRHVAARVAPRPHRQAVVTRPLVRDPRRSSVPVAGSGWRDPGVRADGGFWPISRTRTIGPSLPRAARGVRGVPARSNYFGVVDRRCQFGVRPLRALRRAPLYAMPLSGLTRRPESWTSPNAAHLVSTRG